MGCLKLAGLYSITKGLGAEICRVYTENHPNMSHLMCIFGGVNNALAPEPGATPTGVGDMTTTMRDCGNLLRCCVQANLTRLPSNHEVTTSTVPKPWTHRTAHRTPASALAVSLSWQLLNPIRTRVCTLTCRSSLAKRRHHRTCTAQARHRSCLATCHTTRSTSSPAARSCSYRAAALGGRRKVNLCSCCVR